MNTLRSRPRALSLAAFILAIPLAASPVLTAQLITQKENLGFRTLPQQQIQLELFTMI